MSDAKKPDLMSRSLIDLREMLERENKLLANERFLARLKDKGEKIRQFRDEIERAIQIKQSLEETESFLARLSLGEKAILPKHPMVSRWRVILVAFNRPIVQILLILFAFVLILFSPVLGEQPPHADGQASDRQPAEELGRGEGAAQR